MIKTPSWLFIFIFWKRVIFLTIHLDTYGDLGVFLCAITHPPSPAEAHPLSVFGSSYALRSLVRFYAPDTMGARTRPRSLPTSFYLLLLLSHLDDAFAFEVTLLHTNDNHGRIEETSVDSGKCPQGGPCFAGVARRLTKVSEIRAKEKNVLLLDAGDQFQGTIWFNYYKGAEAAYFMNKLGYDAMVKYLIYLFICIGNLVKPDHEPAEKSVLQILNPSIY